MNTVRKKSLILLIFLSISLVVYYFVQQLYFFNTTQEIALNNASDKVKEREIIFKTFLKDAENDLVSIRNSTLFQNYLKYSNNSQLLEDMFITYSKANSNFMQLRFIDKNGLEKIRVDKRSENSEPYLISRYDLQDKSDRYYFEDSKTKELEKVWFSALDLNVERGKVEVPYKPTLRAVLPITDLYGNFGGILIINYFMKEFLLKFTNTPFYDMVLYNDKGYTMYHYGQTCATEEKCWGNSLDHKYNISNDFEDDYKLILSKPMLTTNSFLSKKMDVEINDGINIILKLRKTYLDEQQKRNTEQFFINSLLTIVFLLLIVYFFFSRLKHDEETIFTFARFVEEKDTYTSGHSKRVAIYSREIAKFHGLSGSIQDKIYKAGLIHDIGKLVTPESVLLNPKKLSKSEYELMKLHASVGSEMISQVSDFKSIAKIVRHHHERYDGKGYPDGISQGDIPLLSRIMTIADAFDAMTTTRIYKSKKTIDEAIAEIIKYSGTQFDPDLVNSAVKYFKTLDDIEVSDQNIFTEDNIEAKRLAYFFEDPVTLKYNAKYLDAILANNEGAQNYKCLNIISVRYMSKYNKLHGWNKGDILLQEIAECLHEKYSDSIVFRIHGDYFVILGYEHISIDREEILKCFHDYIIDLELKHIDLRENEILSYKILEEYMW
ncbi:HD domain-containing phosphohydrolase [Sulfurimonas sp.]|uniref:HD domain-containing phosphohydrolase n=1 Tax=Sulfurimonas sp. TaxID=2022749 RepID=UPI00356B2CF1